MSEVDPASPVPPSTQCQQATSLCESYKVKFTVVTVTYNAEHTLERTLQSVASQTYPCIEHLIVDGLSSDGTLSLIQEYVEDNSINVHPHEIRFIREPDRGLYDAMNKAILEAQGDYLVFLNAGDKYHSSDALEKMVAGFQTYANQLPSSPKHQSYGTCHQHLGIRGNYLGLQQWLCSSHHRDLGRARG